MQVNNNLPFQILSDDLIKKISTYARVKERISIGNMNRRLKADFGQNLVDIHSRNPDKNPDKIAIIQNENINLTSEDTVSLIRNGNQNVRDALTEHRKTELNDYNLHDYMTIHDDITAENADNKINIIADNTKAIGHLEMRKLVEFSSHDDNILSALAENREPELASLVNSDTILSSLHLHALIEIRNETSDLALVMNPNRVLSEHNMLSLIYNERLYDERDIKTVCHQLLQSRQRELIENPFVIAVLAMYDNRNLRSALLSSNLPIRQTVLNGIFEGGNPDDIHQLMQSERLDNQWAIVPSTEHDNNFNNGNIITDAMIKDYIKTIPLASRRRNVPFNQSLVNQETLQIEYNQIQHRRLRREFNQLKEQFNQLKEQFNELKQEFTQQRNVRRRIE